MNRDSNLPIAIGKRGACFDALVEHLLAVRYIATSLALIKLWIAIERLRLKGYGDIVIFEILDLPRGNHSSQERRRCSKGNCQKVDEGEVETHDVLMLICR